MIGSVISSLHTFSGSRNPFFMFHGDTLFDVFENPGQLPVSH